MFQAILKTHKGLVSREQHARDFFKNFKDATGKLYDPMKQAPRVGHLFKDIAIIRSIPFKSLNILLLMDQRKMKLLLSVIDK